MLLLVISILIFNRQIRLLDINIPALGHQNYHLIHFFRARTAEFGLE